MFETNDFALSIEEMEILSERLKDRYCLNSILNVHSGMLIAPRLISMKILPAITTIDFMDPDFRMDTHLIACSMRIFGLSSFGMLHFLLIDRWNVNSHRDIGNIISAMKQLYDDSSHPSGALWVSTLVDLSEGKNRVFLPDPLLKDDIFEEMSYSEWAMDEAFDMHQKDKAEMVELDLNTGKPKGEIKPIAFGGGGFSEFFEQLKDILSGGFKEYDEYGDPDDLDDFDIDGFDDDPEEE